MVTYTKENALTVANSSTDFRRRGVMKMSFEKSTFNFLAGGDLEAKVQKVEQMLEKASDDLSRATSANETIYRRACKETLVQVLRVLKED